MGDLMLFGVDYTGGLSAATLKAATVAGNPLAFVCRYLSHYSGKNLSLAEARSLSGAGLWIVVVWEDSATEAENGHAAGVADATEALRQANACGMPTDRPIYFAVDEQTTVGPSISAYFRGVASVLGLAATGCYGDDSVISALFDAGLIRWGWQTYAWSGNAWDVRGHLQQYSNDHTIAGHGVDYDRAIKTDFGQWRVGVSPAPQPQEDDDMLSAQLRFGDDGKCPLGWAAGKYSAIGFWADNTFSTTDGAVKAAGPCKLRVAVHHEDGTWQLEQTVVVGNAQGKPNLKTVIHFANAAKVDGCAITRADGSTITISVDAS